MSDEFADDVEGAVQSDAAAVHAALGSASATEEAREYLRKQSQIADLQIDSLKKKDEFELSHLRFRRFSDYARFALELSVGFVVLLIVLGLGTMVWNASQDRDLVVDAFAVPPDIAQTGLTGSALANRILDRVGAMDQNTASFSKEFSNYHSAVSQDVRVEIPDTGISIGELNRYLRGWLGSETHVTGELVKTPSGLSLTTRYGNQPGVTIEGKPDDLNALVQRSAEVVFRDLQPLRFADYLSSHKRTAEARVIAEAETQVGDNAHRAQAYVSLGSNDYWTGDSRALAEDGRRAVDLDPNNGLAWFMLEAYSNNLDHEEENLSVTRSMLKLAREGHLTTQDKDVTAALPVEYQAIEDILLGDNKSGADACKSLGATRHLAVCNGGNLIGVYAAIYEIQAARGLIADEPAKRKNGSPNVDLMYAIVQTDLPAGDYAAAVAESKKAEALSTTPDVALNRDVFLRPYEAEALARTGDIAGGRKIAAATPDDCDTCLRARGRVEMLAHNWEAAAHWFAIVSKRAPSLPFADADWGMMLMAKGDLDGAIAKFASANQKGPNFADPLEKWGEALIAKNRSDLALAKFEEANKHAPNWGRLHLKWAEALWWSGDRAGAKTQLAIASGLDLTQSEKSELERMNKTHG